MRDASWLILVMSDLQTFCASNGLNISADAIREAAKAVEQEVAAFCTLEGGTESSTFETNDHETMPEQRHR